jgi:hypothetical protein
MWLTVRHNPLGLVARCCTACTTFHGLQVTRGRVNSAYGAVCHATDVVVPTSTEQAAAAIKLYAKAAAQQPVHIRATHK